MTACVYKKLEKLLAHALVAKKMMVAVGMAKPKVPARMASSVKQMENVLNAPEHLQMERTYLISDVLQLTHYATVWSRENVYVQHRLRNAHF